MNTIPNLGGKICEKLVRQDYWYNGQVQKGVNLLFLKIQDEKWHRFFFDCGVLFWREADAPDIWQTGPSDEYHYPQTEIGFEYCVEGKNIKNIKVKVIDERPTLYIYFSNEVVIVLKDFCEYQLLDFE